MQVTRRSGGKKDSYWHERTGKIPQKKATHSSLVQPEQNTAHSLYLVLRGVRDQQKTIKHIIQQGEGNGSVG